MENAFKDKIITKLREHIREIGGLEDHALNRTELFTSRVMVKRAKSIKDAVESLLNEEELGNLLSSVPEN